MLRSCSSPQSDVTRPFELGTRRPIAGYPTNAEADKGAIELLAAASQTLTMKWIAATIAVIALIGCRTSRRAVAPTLPIPPAAPIRLAQCEGPASSLPDSLARNLPRRTGRMIPDDRWADLAATVPGGFAGVLYDSAHTPILMLTKPAQATAAKQALVGKISFPLQQATVRQARWDFAQLVDWFNYVFPRLGVGPVTADKDEALNRIRFSVTSVELRDRVVSALAQLPLPCDLVVVDLNGLSIRL
jgi:hypothetical protein